ncbi:unnamed protein product [Rotaria sp. Silwood1]|nr:unnamed protein product [Rotaria sp. Silwood1]
MILRQIICLAGCAGDWTNTALPSGSFSGPTAFGLWDDLYIYSGTSESVYYGATGTYPNRNMVFEFYMAHYSSSTRYFHFQIVFNEASPNIVTYKYYQVADGGASATVGVQSSGSGSSITYSVDSVIRIKLEFSEQSLEQERSISNEAKLNVQLLSNRLSDMETKYERLKSECINQERKIDELERQCSNEKLLRTTLSKIQSDLETNCAQTQKLTIDYEKQLKNLRDELANYRRKFRNNEDKYNQIVNKIFEYLRLTKIINETTTTSTNQSDGYLPTLKQLEELKINIEQLKNSKIEQTNEINRLKKTIERLNKTSLNQKQIEHQTEVNREKLQIELDECREKKEIIEENFQRTKLECQNLIKENEKKCLLLNIIDVKIKNLIGNNSSKNIEFNLNELEKQWKNCQLKINSLEEKLIERDNGTLQLTQKLEEQVYNLKHDLDQRHQIFFNTKKSIITIKSKSYTKFNFTITGFNLFFSCY